MTSYDASTDPQLTLLGAVLAHLLEHARRHDVDVLLVGAAARDVLIRHATGALPQRATADVDIAVAVADWAAYTRLTAELSPAGRSSHTFRVADIEVDIVPFGGIETADRTISWPDGYVMNTLGFREALGCAITVTLPGGANVKVARAEAVAPMAADERLEILNDRKGVRRPRTRRTGPAGTSRRRLAGSRGRGRRIRLRRRTIVVRRRTRLTAGI